MSIQQRRGKHGLADCIGSRTFFISLTVAASLACMCASTGAKAATETVLYAFQGGGDGAWPSGGVVEVNGTFYGTTENGGAYNAGTVFSLTPDGHESVIFSFGGGDDGSTPSGAGLIYVGGLLYGTTMWGGSFGQGTVFSVTTSGAESVLHSFGSGADGALPVFGLTKLGNALYGVTEEGGNSDGTVYSVSLTGQERVVYAFKGGDDGSSPFSALTIVKGVLYGTTSIGGDPACNNGYGCGTVYSVTTTGNETILHAFSDNPDGLQPEGGLLAANGLLWGTTEFGGEYNRGIVFSITSGGSESIAHSFWHHVRQPNGNLVKVGGKLYGITYYGGDRECNHAIRVGCGIIYSLSQNGKMKILYSFKGGADGRDPTALSYRGGIFYGTTAGGGGSLNCDAGCGTVFVMKP